MNKKNLLAIALTLIAGTGLGSWLTTRAAAPVAQATAHADHGEESATDGEQHAENDAEEEGHLKLSAEQISAAGIQLTQAGPQAMDLSLPFPGEVRFDEDRTAHVVPRTPGVVEQVLVNLGQPVKKGQLLAVIASQQISDQRSEQAAALRRVELARTAPLMAGGRTWQPGYSYRNQFWISHNRDGAYEALGAHGQMIHINPAVGLVVVRLSSHPQASSGATFNTTRPALEALADWARGRKS